MLHMSKPTVPTLVHRVAVATQERDAARRERDDALALVATFRAELAASMLRYQGHTVTTLDGVPTIVMGSGEVYQMVTGGTFTEQETTYRREFRPLPPVPGSPAARVAAVLASEAPRDGMDVVHGEEALAS